MRKKTLIKALWVILPIAALAYILANWEKLKGKFTNTPGTPTPGTVGGGYTPGSNGSGGNVGGNTQLNYDRVLQQGVSGAEVEVLQALINQHAGNITPLVVDGIFGPLTKAALYSWIGKNSTTLNEIYGN